LPTRARGRKWESSRPIGASWGYNREETDANHSTAATLVREVFDVVAHGGNCLLHVVRIDMVSMLRR